MCVCRNSLASILNFAYEGRERLPGTREAYRLREKQVYCHAGARPSFWAHKWDLCQVRSVILGGDGAAWVRAGADTFPGATWQLDGFHLARACRQAFGSQAGRKLYEKLRSGETTLIPISLSRIPVREGKQAQHARQWVEKVATENWGTDWREHQEHVPEEAAGLGCMEGNQAQWLAARMKGKDSCWSPRGAYHMAKVQELLANGELQRWCYRQENVEKPRTRYRRNSYSPMTAPNQWLQAGVPAFQGPFPNAPWVQHLRKLIHPNHLLI